MADALYELLVPHFDAADGSPRPPPPPPAASSTTAQYLNHIPTLDTASLTSAELQSLSQISHSNLVSLQALANRSHKTFITSADNHRSLQKSLPQLARETQRLRDAIPKLDEEAVRFSSTYSKTGDSQILERRKKALQLARNVDRLSDILELPTLLSTAVSSSSGASSAGGGGGGGGGTGGTSSSGSLLSTSNYSAALDLFAHIKRLQTLYPESPLARDITNQAEDAMKDMTTNLISDLRVQNIRLAPAMRIIGWLRRIAPDLEEPSSTKSASGGSTGEGAFGALFLVCRLANLLNMLSALEPLRELADQETVRRRQNTTKGETSEGSKNNTWSGGQQTERFLKKYIEIYREQSFAIVSLYKNIFAPGTLDSAAKQQEAGEEEPSEASVLSQLPPALATFPMHLAQLLAETLEEYLPNVRDKSSRESLLTQVLYCAASLGRLGGDFTMMLSLLSTTGGTDEDEEDGDENEAVPEWEEAIRKHRILAERLDLLTAGGEAAGGAGAKGSSSSK
ncbi:Dor1-domain-containing protein [Trichophyton interdigitale]|nr:Dor1-domain-containing protein [Trichophyton interdigitale]KAG8209202.1 Dor1-domain-containing protein [Trichophyton interdigitale]